MDGYQESVSHPNATALTAPNLTFDDDCWAEGDIPARPWIAPGYVLRRSVTILAGVPGGGKSSMAVSWATALAIGQPFGSFKPVNPCRVLTYNTEDDGDEQRRRFSASVRQCGRQIADLTGSLIRVGVERIGTLFGNCGSRGASSDSFGPLPAMLELEARIEAFRPDVLILDPLVELHDRDENDNNELRRVVAEFRSLAAKHNMAVVLLHHTRKGSASAAGDMDSIRGGGAIPGAARVALTITKMSEEDAKSFGIAADKRHLYVRLDEAKANYSVTEVDWFEKTIYKLDNEEFVMALSPWSPPVDVVSLETRNAIVADIEAGSSDGPWSTKMGSDPRSIKQLFLRHGITTRDGQAKLLAELQGPLGFEVACFRRPKNGGKAQGLRSGDGKPLTARWVEEEDDQ